MSTSATPSKKPKQKGGRPSKGDRHARLLRFELKVNSALERAAAAEGKSVQDFLDAIVVEKVAPFMEGPDQGQLMTA
jgi:hypothetical protein